MDDEAGAIGRDEGTDGAFAGEELVAVGQVEGHRQRAVQHAFGRGQAEYEGEAVGPGGGFEAGARGVEGDAGGQGGALPAALEELAAFDELAGAEVVVGGGDRAGAAVAADNAGKAERRAGWELGGEGFGFGRWIRERCQRSRAETTRVVVEQVAGGLDAEVRGVQAVRPVHEAILFYLREGFGGDARRQGVEGWGEGEGSEESEKGGHGRAEATRRVGRDCQRESGCSGASTCPS